MVAAEWLKWRQPILSPTTVDDIVKRLEKHVMPRFGDKPIAEVSKADIKTVLDKLQTQGTYEARRQIRTSISQVLSYAIDTDAAPGVIDWTTQLRRMYTSPFSKRKHRAALTKANEIKGLMQAIEAYEECNKLSHLAI